MAVYGLLAKAAGTVVTGLVGVTAYELARKALDKAPLHETAVSAAELGLRGTRKAEEAASRRGSRSPHRDGRSPGTCIGEERTHAVAVGDLHEHDNSIRLT